MDTGGGCFLKQVVDVYLLLGKGDDHVFSSRVPSSPPRFRVPNEAGAVHAELPGAVFDPSVAREAASTCRMLRALA